MSATDVCWGGGREPLYRVVASVVDVAVRASFRLRVVGGERLPKNGPAILAANHLSYWDPLALGVAAWRHGRRVRFFAQEPLFRRPVIGWVLRKVKQIPVYRGLGTEQATERVRAALDAGEVVVVYPEGTIPAPGECPPAKPGIGLLAARCDVPILPVATWGVQQDRARWRLRQRAAVVVGERLDLPDVPAGDQQAQQAVADTVLAIIRALIPRAQRVCR